MFTCLWAAPCQSSVSSAVNHVEMEMFVPQSTNPTDISSLLPSSSSLHFPAFSLLLFVYFSSCVSIEEGHHPTWWPSAECHISIIQRAIFWPLSLSLSRYFKVIWAVDPSLSKKRRRNKDWWKTSFPDFRINTACWVDRQQQGEMFHVCNSHASCHKNIGRARQRSTLCSMTSLKCWISWKNHRQRFSCPSNCHFFLDCECW